MLADWVLPRSCRRYAYVAQFFDHNIAAVDLEIGAIAPTLAATLTGAPGGSGVNQAVSLCGSGRHLYASESRPNPGFKWQSTCVYGRLPIGIFWVSS